jgi:hypothetical protein
VWSTLVMAMPSLKSRSARVVTPINDSEFVRTKPPTRSDSRGNPSALAFSFSRSGTVPRTPPAKITLLAVNVRRRLPNQPAPEVASIR